jgi:5'-3' exonuclease
MKCDYVFLDGKNLLFRMHASHRQLSAKIDGEQVQTGGMYGFLASSARIFRKFQGRVMVAWEDPKGQNWRYNFWPTYKPREKGGFQDVLDQEVEQQREKLIEVLGLLGVRQYRASNCEADDVLARLASASRAKKKTCVIYSGDTDMLQLVGDGVKVACSSKGQEIIYTPKTVLKRLGVRPSHVAAFKALAGDSSDGIPGAKGVGPVAAAKLLNQYGNLDAIAEAVMAPGGAYEWPVQEKMRVAIEELINDDLLWRFSEITTLNPSLRSRCLWQRLSFKRDVNAAYGALKRYGMHSLAMTAQHWTALVKMGSKQ